MVKGPCIAVLAAIDLKGGMIHFMTKTKSIKKADFIKFITELNDMCHERLTLFLDNASIHKARDSVAVMDALDCRPHWNMPYRPDLNCIEIFWGVEKALFRQKLLHETLNPTGKSLMEMTRESILAVSKETTIKIVKKGIKRLKSHQQVHSKLY